MDDEKKKAVCELINTVNDLDLASIMLLANGANMLRAKEQLDLAALLDTNQAGSDMRAG